MPWSSRVSGLWSVMFARLRLGELATWERQVWSLLGWRAGGGVLAASPIARLPGLFPWRDLLQRGQTLDCVGELRRQEDERRHGCRGFALSLLPAFQRPWVHGQGTGPVDGFTKIPRFTTR